MKYGPVYDLSLIFVTVMGRALVNGLSLMGAAKTSLINTEVNTDVEDMVKLCEDTRRKLTQREKQHVHAVKMCADGYVCNFTFNVNK